MGNALASPCFPAPHHGLPSAPTTSAKLIFWGGATRLLPLRRLAGEVMLETPDSLVCHADSFFIGQPIPALAIEDELLPGETYFVLPADRLPCSTLTAASIAMLSSAKGKGQPPPPLLAGVCPFQYVKGGDGRAHIRVLPEFITAMISCSEGVVSGGEEEEGDGDGAGELCSTPELRKHYDQLVGPRSRPWSPRLETITEICKVRMSPRRFLACDLRW